MKPYYSEDGITHEEDNYAGCLCRRCERQEFRFMAGCLSVAAVLGLVLGWLAR